MRARSQAVRGRRPTRPRNRPSPEGGRRRRSSLRISTDRSRSGAVAASRADLRRIEGGGGAHSSGARRSRSCASGVSSAPLSMVMARSRFGSCCRPSRTGRTRESRREQSAGPLSFVSRSRRRRRLWRRPEISAPARPRPGRNRVRGRRGRAAAACGRAAARARRGTARFRSSCARVRPPAPRGKCRRDGPTRAD